MQLNCVTPEVVDGYLVVKLDKIEVGKEEKKWRNALIVYVLGHMPGYNYMRRYVGQIWSNVSSPDLFYHDKGYYVVKFKSEEDMNEIFYTGPYSMNNRPLILKKWCPNFDFSAEFLTEVPLWVKFPRLPVSCWSGDSLSRIANALGVPLFADEYATNQSRISFARMVIEVNVTKPIPESIAVMDPSGQVFHQPVLFDWKPKYCEKCLTVGHNCVKKAQTQKKPQERIIRKKKVVQKCLTRN